MNDNFPIRNGNKISFKLKTIWKHDGKEEIGLQSMHRKDGDVINLELPDGRKIVTNWEQGFTYGSEPREYEVSGKKYHLVYFNVKQKEAV